MFLCPLFLNFLFLKHLCVYKIFTVNHVKYGFVISCCDVNYITELVIFDHISL